MRVAVQRERGLMVFEHSRQPGAAEKGEDGLGLAEDRLFDRRVMRNRNFDVRVKLNLISELVKGKRVIVVDDSIVRGTTCKARVNNLKEAGAKEVHVLVSCPPHMNPCVYGIDFPDRNKLMAANHSLEEIRRYLNADSLHYLSKEGMIKATGLPATSFCMACYRYCRVHALPIALDGEQASIRHEYQAARGQ